MSKVVVTDYAFNDLQIEKAILEAEGLDVVSQKKFEGKEKLMELVADADYVITQFAPVNAEVISAMKQCKLIVRYGIGVDNVDLKAAADRGIPVCNVPDFCTDEVADHTLAMILALTRKLIPCWDVIRKDRKWTLPVPVDKMFVLREMTVGLVAYGKIARQVALRLKPFKCKVLVFDPAVQPSIIEMDGCIPASLDEVISKSDIISLHCPSTEKTRFMINKDSIGRMKKGVLLVNAGRGDLVKGEDLIAALQNGQIGAAAVDVTNPEPINMDSPLLDMDNVIINGHIAAASASAVYNLRKSASETVLCAFRGQKLPNVVNGVKS
jgi:D-3-phosphoglycerate dehydrogenase